MGNILTYNNPNYIVKLNHSDVCVQPYTVGTTAAAYVVKI